VERYDESVNEAELAAELFDREGDHGGVAQALWELGWIQYKIGKWKQSVEASMRALELDPKLVPVRFNLALALLHEGNLEESRRQYHFGIDVAEPSELQWNAISDLEGALRLQPDLPGATEILQMLREKYASVTRTRTRRGRGPSSSVSE